MRLVEIRAAEKTVIIDGICLKLDFTLGKNDAVVYWDESVKTGFVEAKKGKGRVIESLEEFDNVIQAFNAKIEEKKTTDITLRIVPEDRMVSVDGIALKFDFEIDPNYHAVHWDGEKGVIETKQGLNVTLVDIDEFANIVTAHAALLEEQEAERISFETDPQRKVEKLAAIRWSHETGGVEVNGIRFWTTRDSLPAWLRMLEDAKADPDFVVPAYKAMSGYVADLTAAQIIEADAAGKAHITKCYLAEMLVMDILDDIDLDGIEQAFMGAYNGIEL